MGKDLKGRELGQGIRQKKDKRYEARALVNGISINICKANLKECKAAFEAAKQKAIENIDVRNQSITLNEWFEEWFDKYKKPHIKETSIFPMKSKYRNTFGDRIGDRRVVDIRNIDIQSAINEMAEEGRAVSSMRDALGRVRDCLESAKNNRIISINPCFDITVPWENKQTVRRFLTVEEQKRFLEEVESNQNWYMEMFYIMFLTGMRVGEVGGLMWNDVDWKNRCIHIQRSLSCQYENGVKTMRLTTPKTHNSYRKIPFMGEAEQMFYSQKEKQEKAKKNLGNRWREEQGMENLVFTSSMGSPVTRYIVEHQINKIVKDINFAENVQSVKENREPVLFEPVYPHAIRHTFCSRCFEKGMNPKVVQTLMGHQHYSTTVDIYTHITEDVMEQEIHKFGTAKKG
ncbi:MAG: site-specific integrase [Lachnospiraceae bacterium]|nr:site-specific integrase [Lachnospiraceae bacterium]